MAELWMQLYACTSILILPFQSDLHSGGNVPTILIKMEFNLLHWPFVWRQYRLVLILLVPVNLQRLALVHFRSFSLGPKGSFLADHNGQ